MVLVVLFCLTVLFFVIASATESKTIECRACDSVISRRAKFCPHCGDQ